MSARIVVVTGERGVGKSTVCHRAVDLARAKEHTCGGILTLSRPNGARDVLNVHTGDVRRLTLRHDTDTGVLQGRFRFDPTTLAWGDDVLASATECDLLVVDELGPLEIERGRGWVGALGVLRTGDFTLALVVVRPELLVQAQLKLPASATTVFTVTHQNRDDLPDVLVTILEAEG
jgi:nucleoside-triphosphatase THEP1